MERSEFFSDVFTACVRNAINGMQSLHQGADFILESMYVLRIFLDFPKYLKLMLTFQSLKARNLDLTIATHTARPIVIQGIHSDKDGISKLCPVSNYLSVCGKK